MVTYAKFNTNHPAIEIRDGSIVLERQFSEQNASYYYKSGHVYTYNKPEWIHLKITVICPPYEGATKLMSNPNLQKVAERITELHKVADLEDVGAIVIFFKK